MKTWIKIVLGLVAIAIVALLLVYKLVLNKQHPDYENVAAAYTLTAPELFQAFIANKDAASGKYNGKMVALTGKLSKIETTDSLVIAVFVFKQGDFGDEGVRCTMLEKFKEAASRLQPDGDFMVKGFCTGYNDTDVILEKCSIINQ